MTLPPFTLSLSKGCAQGTGGFGKLSPNGVDVAGALMSLPSLGEPAVHELLRRVAVNELLGNPDMHLKNIGLYYPDGVKPRLTPPVLREFCARLGLAEKPASGMLRACVRAAFDTWPGMIEASLLTARQKERLLAHFHAHPWIEQVQRRRAGRAAAADDKPAG